MGTTISNDDAMPTLTFRLPSELKERLQQHATKDGKPATTLAREWLAQRLEQLDSGTPTPPESGSTTAHGHAKGAIDPAILNVLRDLLSAVHASAEENNTALRKLEAMHAAQAEDALRAVVMTNWLVGKAHGQRENETPDQTIASMRTELAERMQELHERVGKALRQGGT